jgi:hypothetical protein
MAKETKDGKIQFIYVNVEGDQATLQEALRQVSTVLNRGMNPQPKTLIAVPVTGKALTGNDGNGASNQLYEVNDGHQENGRAEEVSEPSFDKGKRAKRVPKTPPLLRDFDQNSGNVSLKDFVKQKNPSTTIEKYLVIAGWFKDQLGVDEITTSHIFTCFPLMGWVPPDDMAQTFRNIKKIHHYFENGSKNGQWKISIIGLNELAKMTAIDTD